MSISRVIEVSFGGGSIAYAKVDTAYFYNNGILFKPTDLDLPASYQVHWADSPQASSTLETIGTAEGAPIPDDLWGRSRVIYGWIYLHPTEDSGVTAYEVRIYKNVRAGLPDGTEPTPEEQSVIDQAISALNTAVAKTAQDVISADQSARSASDDADRAERARTGAETAQGKAEEAQESAERAKDDAETSERNASESERKAKGYSETASEKADSIHSMTASAQTLPAGSSASASYDAETGVMSFGIPKGKDGTDGDDGYSPTANVSKSGKTATITITDKNGTTTAQVSDGEDGTDGIDGISPSVSVTDITGGHRVVITDKDGAKSFDVEDGATGATPNLTIGTVTTLEPDASATATITGTAENPVLNLGLPKGQTGEVTEEEFTQLKEDLKNKITNANAGMALAIKPQIPTYFFEQPSTPLDFSDIEYLESKIASVPEGKHFFFITDTHWPNNQKHSTQLMSYIGARLGIKHVLFGGDAINDNPTKYLAYQVLASYVNENKAMFGKNFLYCLGNHDNNLANQSGTAEEKQAFVIPYLNIHALTYNGSVNYYDASADLTGIVTDEADYANMVAYFKNCYYLDDAENKIRYIVYNTGTIGDDANLAHKYFGVGNVSESMLCVEWMYNTLMSTPSGYDVVVIGHEPVYEYGNTYLTNSNKQIPTLLMAFKAKATASIWIPTNFDSRLFTWIAKGTHTYNFSQANDVGKVVVLSGHWHQDYIVTVSPSNHVYNTDISGTGSRSNTVLVSQSAGSDVQLPVVVTQCDKVANAGDTSASTMTAGTITEQCFDVVTIANDGRIYMTRIGAGSDRVIEFT